MTSLVVVDVVGKCFCKTVRIGVSTDNRNVLLRLRVVNFRNSGTLERNFSPELVAGGAGLVEINPVTLKVFLLRSETKPRYKSRTRTTPVKSY